MALLFLVWTCLLLMAHPVTKPVVSEIAFCNFVLPSEVMSAHSTFTLVYSFELNDEGRPTKVTRIKDEYVGKSIVASCITDWRFQGLKGGSHMAAVFQWQHALGWTELRITGPGISQRIKVTGVHCPYSGTRSDIIPKSAPVFPFGIFNFEKETIWEMFTREAFYQKG